MKLTFLGTRGEIEARTKRHRMHTALMVSWQRSQVMIDCGDDWLGNVQRLKPDAIVITHAHPDHAGGLKKGAPCPVVATPETWNIIGRWPLSGQAVAHPRVPMLVCGIQFEPFSLEHSIRAPAVGYRITAGRVSVFYAPDVAGIHERQAALRGVRIYLGDGASLNRPILRKRGRSLIGHASIRTQLEWCRGAGVQQAIFTHCGSQIVAGDERAASEKLAAIAKQTGVEARIATDSLQLVVR